MKKIITVLFILAASWAGEASVMGSQVFLTQAEGTAGETVEVPIQIDSAAGVAGFQMTITFDSTLLEIKDVVSGGLTSGWMIQENLETAGQIRIVGLDSALTGLKESSGTLAILRFNIMGTAEADVNLVFTECKLSDVNGEAVESTPFNSRIIISAAPTTQPADSSEDNATDGTDSTTETSTQPADKTGGTTSTESGTTTSDETTDLETLASSFCSSSGLAILLVLAMAAFYTGRD